jgi:hypothetical protein
MRVSSNPNERRRRSRKPIIGHNMILDVLLMMHHFVEPLPPKLPQFVEMVNSVMPEIYDTKCVISPAASSAGDRS